MDGLDEFQKLCCPKPQICCIMVSVNLMNQHSHRLFTMTAQLRRDERRSGCFCCSLFSPPRCLSNIWWPFHAYNPMQNKCFPGEMPCSSHIKTTLRLPRSLWLLASNVAKPKLSGKSWEQALRNHSFAFKRQFHLIILFFLLCIMHY